MTCESFRELVAGKPFEETTRGERASILKHALDCPECRQFVNDHGGRGPPSGEADLMRRDMQDEEFRRVVE